MKTKIIYISGNELFDMADIRSAFDEVRAALSLGPDTVLFGVPVDNDDALSVQKPAEDIVEPVAEPIIEPIVEPIVDITPDIAEPIAEEKKTTTRRTRKSVKVVPITDAINHDEHQTEHDTEAVNEPAPVVPISSVLVSKSDAGADNDITEPIESENTTVENDDVDAESVTINDMIADDAPVAEHEKTLEELLESMTPLGEDADKTEEAISVDDEEIITPETDAKSDNDIDITLEKLATEFVENQDKINMPVKPAARGKIGKLKNILPFKKAKHDDSGLMGDLFGWAGVAANDEDFTIPGFFK